jgi:hypothetical protein
LKEAGQEVEIQTDTEPTSLYLKHITETTYPHSEYSSSFCILVWKERKLGVFTVYSKCMRTGEETVQANSIIIHFPSEVVQHFGQLGGGLSFK